MECLWCCKKPCICPLSKSQLARIREFGKECGRTNFSSESGYRPGSEADLEWKLGFEEGKNENSK